MPGLSCGTQDLRCGMQTSLVAKCRFLAAACLGDLVPRPGMEPRPPALGAWSLTHWATREVPKHFLFAKKFQLYWGGVHVGVFNYTENVFFLSWLVSSRVFIMIFYILYF